MSQPRFAAITSSLLARKGEARPWTDVDRPPPVKQPLAWRQPEFIAEAAAPESLPLPELPPLAEPQTGSRADWKKYALRISHHDYERLGILAVKQGKTRQRLLQETVDQLFTGMTQAFGGNCPCLGPEKRF